MRITSLGSGSSGNAYLVEAGPQGRTRLLVDAGFSARILAERLRLAGCGLDQLRAVLITHEHSDHILGLPPLMRRYHIPVFADPRTLAEIRTILTSGELRSESGLLLSLEAELPTLANDGSALLARETGAQLELTPTNRPRETSENASTSLPLDSASSNQPRETSESSDITPPGLTRATSKLASTGGPGETSGLRDITPTSPLRVTDEPAPTHVPHDATSSRLPREASGLSEAGPGADELWRALPVGTSCVIGDIEVQSFPVSHDAIAPCGYVLSAGGCRVCIVTDSGEVTPVMLEAIARADLLILESNHDRARLIRGPYPYHLKQRILSPTGHLSNDQAAEAVLRTWRADAVRWLWLAHLSRTNNTPRLALSSMKSSLRAAGANLAQVHISVLRHEMGGTWDSTRLWHDEHWWDLSH
jgi:phosphoribosyl 1,2-cyclic phosphodiesterase